MLANKQARAELIISRILASDGKFGRIVPVADRTKMGREISWDGRWKAKIIPDQRLVMGRVYNNRFGDRYVEDGGCRVFNLMASGKTLLQANLRGSEVTIYRYSPGAWEAWFGVDNGDDRTPFGPECFARPGSPEEKQFLQNIDADLAPARTGPSNDSAGSDDRTAANPPTGW